MALHWQDIVELLISDILDEEVLELNEIEDRKTEAERRKERLRSTNLADQSMSGKFHDFQSVDLRNILGVFEDYKAAEQSIKTRLM